MSAYATIPTLREIALPGLRAIRSLWRPFLAIQLCALGVVVAYFNSEGFREGCAVLAEMKSRGGVLFAAAALAFASGVAPEIFKFATGDDRSLTAARFRLIGFNICLYACMGVIVERFYWVLSITLGDEPTLGLIVSKVLLDQLVFTPLCGIFLIGLAFTWREHHFSLRRTFAVLGWAWYLRRVGSLLIPTWCYWFPMATLMYMLPAGLTFVFSATASAAATLVIVRIASAGTHTAAAQVAPDAVVLDAPTATVIEPRPVSE